MSEPTDFDQAAILRERVKVMRELGVVRWGTIELGPQPAPTPQPPPVLTDKERTKRAILEAFEAKRAKYRRQLGRVPSDEELDGLP